MQSQKEHNTNQVRENRTRLRNAIKQLQFQKKEEGSPLLKSSHNKTTGRQIRKRKASECLKNFQTLSTLKDVSIKQGFEELFTLKQKLGEGAHSVVYRCQELLTHRDFAVKITKRKDLQLMENMRECYQILKELNSENIIKGYYFFMNEKKITCYMVCELCEYPTLKEFIFQHRKDKKKKNTFSEEVVAAIAQSILDSLAYLAEKGVCHRDIKPQNILYDPQEGSIKLIDFQLAKMQRYTHEKLQLWSNTGTLHYRAPETFKSGYGLSVDIWSLGIICYEMLVGQVPFKSSYYEDTVNEILNKDIEFEELMISQSAKFFLKKLLQKNAEKRITAKQALSCPFILKNSTKCTLQSPSRLNSSFEESQQFLDHEQDFALKFYDENVTYSFLGTISQDIGVRRCQEDD